MVDLEQHGDVGGARRWEGQSRVVQSQKESLSRPSAKRSRRRIAVSVIRADDPESYMASNNIGADARSKRGAGRLGSPRIG
jgi:hypothetical protein